MQIQLRSTIQALFSTWMSRNVNKSRKKPDLSSFPLSDYVKKLGPLVKQRYLEKISVTGIDPVLIQVKHFVADCLPPMECTDLLFYVVLETSFYTLSEALQLIIRWCLDSLLAFKVT